jgi:hypothetical protein
LNFITAELSYLQAFLVLFDFAPKLNAVNREILTAARNANIGFASGLN